MELSKITVETGLGDRRPSEIDQITVSTQFPFAPTSPIIQLIAGRTGQEFNERKGRQGAFWEDHYHATAVETDEHLLQCIVYNDLNMVRAGVVGHPSEWGSFGGYNEIQNPKKRYALIDHAELIALIGLRDLEDLIRSHAAWVDEALQQEKRAREGKWTETIAVGSKGYVDTIKDKLGALFLRRRVEGKDGQYELQEPPASYDIVPNTFPWQQTGPTFSGLFS